MEYGILGKSDLKISRLGFGTMSLDLGNSRFAESLLLQGLEEGINYFDTADLYNQGMNESLLGSVFRHQRDRVILASKVGNIWKPDQSGWYWSPSKKYIFSAIEKSLKRLQTDYIDLYQLHGGTLEDPIDEIIDAFEILKAAGKIRYYGISSIRPNVIREYVKRSSIVSVMMQYSILDRRPEEEMLAFLLKSNVGVLARGSIARGLLISKQAEPYLNYTASEVDNIVCTAKGLINHKRSAESMSIQYVLEHKAIHAVVIGIRTHEQLAGALKAYHSDSLTNEEMQHLSNKLPANYYETNR
jgi:aryl-alcohol dehydrogenase-like predicted oxidoreductase